MEQTERNRRIAEQREALVGSLEAHIGALEELSTTTNFDFDVATDIHPHLLDDNSAGRKQLKKWQEVYAALENGPNSMVTLRWDNGLAQGCHGFGQEAKYETKAMWLRIYENISADALEFVKGHTSDEPSRVVINHPHSDIVWKAEREVVTTFSTEAPAVLYEQSAHRDDLFSYDERYASNEIFVFGDSAHTATDKIHRIVSSSLSLDAQMDTTRFIIDDKALKRREAANKA